MKFQNPSFNFFLNGRTNRQTNKRTGRKQYAPHFFKVGGIKTKFLCQTRAVTLLRKTMIYNTNVDLVNDNVYTKFGLNWSIRFQDIEQKLNSDVNQGL